MRFLILAFALASGAYPTSSTAGPRRLLVPDLDIAQLQAEDQAKSASEKEPYASRYAVGAAVQVDPRQVGGKWGAWEDLPNGARRWTLEVDGRNARSLSFGFDRFRLPNGAKLLLVGVHSGEVQGPFDDSYNPVSGQWWSPMVRDRVVRLELTLPAERVPYLDLQLGTVMRGYRGFLDEAPEKIGACNVDAVCPAGDAWRDQIDSVAAVSYSTNGNRDGLFCSGQFVNNTATPGDPLFLTSKWCGISANNAPSAVAYLNFQHPTCRPTGTNFNGLPGRGALDTFVSGATLLAVSLDLGPGTNGARFRLLRFNTAPSPEANVFYSGWDRRDALPEGPVATIHHAMDSEKRISVEFEHVGLLPEFGAQNLIPDAYLYVRDFDEGSLGLGSNGAGLWNSDGRLIGVLYIGSYACADSGFSGTQENARFGRLSFAWEEQSDPSAQLRAWLDPIGGFQVLDGFRPSEDTPTVEIHSPAFDALPEAGSDIELEAVVENATDAFSIEWDTNGDGFFERKSESTRLTLRYPNAVATQIRVRVTDSASRTVTASRAIEVLGPEVEARAASAPVQICGNGDGQFDPGERWQVAVSLHNAGDVPMPTGHALFSAGDPSDGPRPSFVPDAFGHRGYASKDGECSQAWIDISDQPALTLSLSGSGAPTDKGHATITFEEEPFTLYGETYATAVASVNGYLSFSMLDTGGGQSLVPDCNEEILLGGPRLHVFYQNLVLDQGANAGIRYRRFAQCPRPSSDPAQHQPCHVITWTGARLADDDHGNEFQAVLYPLSGEVIYQYRQVGANDDGAVLIGLNSGSPAQDSMLLACRNVRAAQSGDAYCIVEPSRLSLGFPAAATPAIAAGEQAAIDLQFDIDASSSCGGTFGVDYVGATSGALQSFAHTRVVEGFVPRICNAQPNCAARRDLSPRRGLYFNTVRPGNGVNGYFYDVSDDERLFAGLWFTADEERNSTWYLAADEIRGFGGRVPLTRLRNLASPPMVSTQESPVGRAWVGQVDVDSLLFAWEFDDGRVGIERLDTVDQAAPSQDNHTQAWYGPSEPGWGLAIESLDFGGTTQFEFAASYLFDGDGSPRWLVGDKSSARSGGFDLLSVRTYCPACALFPDYNEFSTSAGSMDIQYSSRTNATLSTTIQLPAPLSGSWNRTNLPFQALAEPTP